MWVWAVWGATVVVAAVVQRLWVPRLRTPRIDDGETPPDFSGLGAPRFVLAAAALAAGAGWVFFAAPPHQWLAWVGFVAIGAPLVIVDAATTYLPNQLMYPLWGWVAAGLVVVLLFDPTASLGAALGALAGYGAFWLVWRTSSSFGFGDVRLAAAVGAVAGMSGVTAWVLAFVVGTALGAVAAIVAALRKRSTLPYGPWLWLGPIVALALN